MSYDGTTGKNRTNPQAHSPVNVVKLYGVRKSGDCNYNPTFTYAITGGGATTTFTPTAGHTGVTGLRFMKWRITDADGNTAYGALNVATPAAVAVDTSGLDPLKDWRVEFSAEVKTSGKSCSASWWLQIPAGAQKDNPAGSGQDI